MEKAELLKNLPDLLIEKKVLWFLGSGTSAPGMPLLSDFPDSKAGYDSGRLLAEIVRRNKILLSGRSIRKHRSSSVTIDRVIKSRDSYISFLETVLSTLNETNSRQAHKSTDIFTTNYDLFIEYAADSLLRQNYRFVFNDGSRGYFLDTLDSSNFDTTTAYKGRFDNYVNEIPSINLIKPHGSVNWEKSSKNEILIYKGVRENPELVSPDGSEPSNTVLKRHFYEMFRYFEYEVSKPETVIIVHGFSFGDKHILSMFNRALENSGLLLIIFAYTDDAANEIKHKFRGSYRNLYVISPADFSTKSILVGVGKKAKNHLDLLQLNNIIAHGTMI
ncbi:MAG: SIR2 family protein [Bifidobacteriales bacterium]|nr:SIR2 family protein [Bifidobacteriales bacterium]